MGGNVLQRAQGLALDGEALPMAREQDAALREDGAALAPLPAGAAAEPTVPAAPVNPADPTGRGKAAARYWYMDSLRAVLIIAGVFFHAALPYRTSDSWNVRDPSPYSFFDHFSRVLGSFRMPTFFFVAGFFCALTFAARGPSKNLARRLVAFGVPLLTMMVLLQPVQYLMRLAQDESLHATGWALVKTYVESGA